MKPVIAAAVLFRINLLILVSSSVEAPPPPPPPPPPSPDFNYVVLQWPPTVCNLNPKFCRKTAVKEELTVHGMWPQKNNGPYVDCTPRDAFQKNMLNATVQQDLQAHWPSLLTAKTDDQFWTHEWDEHGSCSGLTIPEYFWTTVKRAQNFDAKVKQILASKGVVPDTNKAYEVGALEAAISGGTNLSPSLQCITGKSTELYLYQIYFCADKHGNKLQTCTAPTKSCVNNPQDDAYLPR